MEKILLHIGYPKTATTTFQDCLFAKHSQIRNLAKPIFYNKDLEKAFAIIKWEDDNEYLKQKIFINKVFSNLVQKTSKLDVFSTEDIIGGNKGKCSEDMFYSNMQRTIYRLYESLHKHYEVLLLIGIRRQDNLSFSRYVQGVHQGIVDSKKETFENYVQNGCSHINKGVFSTHFFYKYILFLESIFQKNLYIMPFERFLENKNKEVADISDFLNIDKDESIRLIYNEHSNQKVKSKNTYVVNKNLYEILQRYRNKYFKNIIVFPDFLKKILKSVSNFQVSEEKFEITNKQRVDIMKIYHIENKALSEKYNLNLDKYGYF